MKRILDVRTHAVLDYMVVVAFAAAPSLLKLSETASKLSYALALIHLVVTIFTRFPLGLIRRLAFSYHALIEFYASVAMIVYGGIILRSTDRVFFVAMGLVILFAFFATDYSEQTRYPSSQ